MYYLYRASTDITPLVKQLFECEAIDDSNSLANLITAAIEAKTSKMPAWRRMLTPDDITSYYSVSSAVAENLRVENAVVVEYAHLYIWCRKSSGEEC